MSPADHARPEQAWPTAATGAVGLIGHPAGHSLSPALHNTALAASGIDWAYLAFDVPPGQAGPAISGAAALGLRGLSVTMPHKAAAAAAVDDLGSAAARLGSVNTVVFSDGRTRGENTDGEGFLAGLREACGFDAAGALCLVLGAGGAARAVVLALAGAGAAKVAVVNRTPERAQSAASLAGPEVGEVLAPEDVAALVGTCDLVVNATPVGMAGGPASFAVPGDGGWEQALDLGRLGPGQVVVDLVYDPAETPLLSEASRGGARVVNGLPMLVHQAAAQFALWTGRPAPIAAMWAAVGGPPSGLAG